MHYDIVLLPEGVTDSGHQSNITEQCFDLSQFELPGLTTLTSKGFVAGQIMS
jgi:hypothetical protein